MRQQRGTSLLETLIATAICTVVMFSLAAMMSSAMKQNKNQGATVAQATTLAAQKLDQLLELPWITGTPPNPDTVDPGLTASPATPDPLVTDTTNYVDYLDKTGGTSVAVDSAAKFFTRRWKIEDQAGGTSKKITVLVIGKSLGNASESSSPQATLACFKVQQ